MEGQDNIQPGRSARPIRTRLVVALILLAFVGGLAVMGWVMVRWQPGIVGNDSGTSQSDDDNAAASAATAAPDSSAGTVPAPSSAAGQSAAPVVSAAELEQHVLDLEQRLMRVSVAAQAASGYANRAEAMMVAFAARRALDAGAPLGYIEGQLRLLFGEAQPKAVATIINAAGEPVTVNKLRAGLDDIDVLIEQGKPGESWWSSTMHAIGSLVVIRHAGAPMPEPEQRLARARRAVEAGQIDDAMADVAALPPQPAIAQWLEQARRYNEAHRALDVIEAAAILEPRATPLVAATGLPTATTQKAPPRNPPKKKR